MLVSDYPRSTVLLFRAANTMMISHLGPLPRLRLYTRLSHYVTVLSQLLSGQAKRGGDVARLERHVAEQLGIAHAVAMPMARVGIYMAIRALIKPGQKVILSPYTIADVVNMVICAGGVPVFADIERQTCNIDPAEVERLIDGDTGAVLVTHFYGLMCDVERIARICRERSVPVIEDAAQAFGAHQGGKAAGTFGAAGVYSFGMYKNVNSFLGGMVITDDARLHARLAQDMAALPPQPLGAYAGKVLSALITDVVTFPLFFRSFVFRLFRFAFLRDIDVINNRLKIDIAPEVKRELPESYRYRMTSLQARLVLGQLDQVGRDMAARIRAAARYHAGLRDITELILPPLKSDGSHMYWYFPIQYDDRHALVAHAMRHGRDITESYHRNCADLPCFASYARPCPNAQATANSLIYLPLYPRYTEAEIDKTIAVIRGFFGK